MKHQAWEPVIFKKRYNPCRKPTALDRANGNVKIVSKKKKINSQKDHDHAKMAKIDRENKIQKVNTIGRELGIKIQQARANKKLSQKQLAQQLNMKQDIIAKYETGKAIYNQRILNKIKKILSIQ